MDNRNDVTEDQQSTPEHAAFNAKSGAGLSGKQDGATASSGLTSGPHNDPPPSPGIEDTYRAPSTRAAQARPWRWTPMHLAFSLAGVTLALLVVRSVRAR